ncbi:MAG: IS481 family transposase [Candidatus Nanopelagicaceae bacterium]|jgi:transposase InsO family protein
MSLARVVVTAVIVEGRSKTQVAKDYGVARSWVYELLKRFEAEGEVAFEPRSRRPHSNPRTTSADIEERIIFWRRSLVEQGHDGGAHTIAYHLTLELGAAPAISTIWKVLKRNGLVVATPKKRPHSSYTRFEASQPNETWQTDFTHWKLRNGRGIEILNFLDDHSRLLIACNAAYVTTGLSVVEAFRSACNEYGLPASVLSDNGAVFTARWRGGRNAFETEMASLKIVQKNSRPYHPQTCGKVERFHHTLKKWLAKQPKVTSIGDFQKQLNAFREYYNFTRPHRALDRSTPAHAYNARPKAQPGGKIIPDHFRIRNDVVDKHGKLSLRYNGAMHHIGIGRAYSGTAIRMLIHEKEIRVITTSGELLKEFTFDEEINYQPQ